MKKMKLITIIQAAEIMGINPVTLRGRIDRTENYNFPKPVSKLRQSLLYDEAEILDYKSRNPVFIPHRWDTSKKQAETFIYAGFKLEILRFLQGDKQLRLHTSRIREIADSTALYQRYAS